MSFMYEFSMCSFVLFVLFEQFVIFIIFGLFVLCGLVVHLAPGTPGTGHRAPVISKSAMNKL